MLCNPKKRHIDSVRNLVAESLEGPLAQWFEQTETLRVRETKWATYEGLKKDLLREYNLIRPRGNEADLRLYTIKQTGLVLQLRAQFRKLLAEADEEVQLPRALLTVFHQALTPKLFKLAQNKPKRYFQTWEDLADWAHEKSIELAPDDWRMTDQEWSNGKPYPRQNRASSRRRRFRKRKRA